MRFLGWFAQWSTNDPIKIIEPFPTAAAIEPLVVNTQATSPSAGSGWSFGGKRLVCVLLNRPVLISVIILGMTAFARADYMQVTGNPVNKQLLSDPDPFAYVYDTYEVTINGVTKTSSWGSANATTQSLRPRTWFEPSMMSNMVLVLVRPCRCLMSTGTRPEPSLLKETEATHCWRRKTTSLEKRAAGRKSH